MSVRIPFAPRLTAETVMSSVSTTTAARRAQAQLARAREPMKNSTSTQSRRSSKPSKKARNPTKRPDFINPHLPELSSNFLNYIPPLTEESAREWDEIIGRTTTEETEIAVRHYQQLRTPRQSEDSGYGRPEQAAPKVKHSKTESREKLGHEKMLGKNTKKEKTEFEKWLEASMVEVWGK